MKSFSFLTLIALLLFGLHTSAANQSQQTSSLKPAPADVEQLVKQSIEDRFAANDLPDGNLLGKATRIGVRDTMPGAGLTLSHAALPHRDGYEFYLLSMTTAQAEAEKTQKPVSFITVDQPSITGNIAEITLGVDMVTPPQAGMVKLCCCSGTARFQRTGNQWTFIEWGARVCS
jgi:hypothetical protein